MYFIEKEEFILPFNTFKHIHAGTIIEIDAKEKELLFACFAKLNEEIGDENENNNIWISRKSLKNDSNGWSTPICAISPNFSELKKINLNKKQKLSCWNPVLCQFNSQILLFFKIGFSPIDWTGCILKSDDQGKSWGNFQILKGVLGPTRNKPLVQNNFLLCPSSRETIADDYSCFDHINNFEETKTYGPLLPLNFPQHCRGFIQPVLFQGKNANEIIALCRPRLTKSYAKQFIHRAYSKDKGQTWSYLEPVNILNPDAAFDGIKLSNNNFLLVYNNIDNEVKDFKIQSPHSFRNRLSLALSKDSGNHWTPIKIENSSHIFGDLEFSLESEKEYSYPSIICDGKGFIHITYTFERQNIKYTLLKSVLSPER